MKNVGGHGTVHFWGTKKAATHIPKALRAIDFSPQSPVQPATPVTRANQLQSRETDSWRCVGSKADSVSLRVSNYETAKSQKPKPIDVIASCVHVISIGLAYIYIYLEKLIQECRFDTWFSDTGRRFPSGQVKENIGVTHMVVATGVAEEASTWGF